MTLEQPPRTIVVYSGMFGTTESAAGLVTDVLAARLGRDVRSVDVAWLDLAELLDYDLLVLGASTWNIGQLPSGWSAKLDELERLDLTGKLVALFGTGDQLGYSETFLDAVGMVADTARKAGARLVGAWPVIGYDFSASLALEGDRFVGLALDDDNQESETHGRVATWVDLVVNEVRVLHEGPIGRPLASLHG